MTTTQLINHYCYGTCSLDREEIKKSFVLSRLKGICHPELVPAKEYCCSIDDSGLEEYILKNPCCVAYEKWEAQLHRCCERLNLKVNIKELVCKIVVNANVSEVNCGVNVNSVVNEELCDTLLRTTVTDKEKIEIVTSIKDK